MQSQLKTVQQIQASYGAFAAILDDGCVVAWGDAIDGGDCSAVQAQLKDVKQIQSSLHAFAAMRSDGSVVRGATLSTEVTAVACSTSFKMCSRSKALSTHLLRHWATDLLLLGARCAVHDKLSTMKQIAAEIDGETHTGE